MKFDVPTREDRPDHAEGRGRRPDTLTYDNIQVANYLHVRSRTRATGWSSGSSPCTFYWAPDYRKITDIEVRKALA